MIWVIGLKWNYKMTDMNTFLVDLETLRDNNYDYPDYPYEKTRLGKVFKFLSLFNESYINIIRKNIPSPGEIKHGMKYCDDNICGDDLLVIYVAISLHCMHNHPAQNYPNDYPERLYFNDYFDIVIEPIANLLGLNIDLGKPSYKYIDGRFYYVRELPNNYMSSDQKFIEKLLSAVSGEDISELAKTITLQN